MSDSTLDDLDFAGASDTFRRSGADEAAADRRGPTLATVAGERVISPVSGRRGAGRGGKVLALIGLLTGCGVFLAATWSHPKTQARKGPEEPVKQVVDYASVKAPTPAPAAGAGAAGPDGAGGRAVEDPGAGAATLAPEGQLVPPIALTAQDAAAARGPAGPGAAGAAQAQAGAALQAAAQREARLHAIRGAPLLVYSAAAAPQGLSAPTLARVATTDAAPASELDGLRRGSAIGTVQAARLPDRNFLISAGAVLPCVLETALDTSAPGFVTCRIPKDVYADSGGVVLLEKGSRVLGEYRSGFQQGRARIFVLWTRVTTPGGVAVDVSSPGSDALGRAGFDGRIDSHFWRRFGGALLLTTVQGALQAAATADARIASVGQGGGEGAAVALQNSVGIPPTLTKPQGAEVAIFVSRDLDFAGVYSLKGR